MEIFRDKDIISRYGGEEFLAATSRVTSCLRRT
jgi:GGDEF domain-containing protein